MCEFKKMSLFLYHKLNQKPSFNEKKKLKNYVNQNENDKKGDLCFLKHHDPGIYNIDSKLIIESRPLLHPGPYLVCWLMFFDEGRHVPPVYI